MCRDIKDDHSFDFHQNDYESAGGCQVCGGDILKYEYVLCDCNRAVHMGCTETCEHCGHVGCKACMVDTDDGWFCLEECQEEYNRIRKEQ